MFAGRSLIAETGKLLLEVEDAQRRPIQGIEIGIEGAGGSALTGDDGRVLLALPKDINENDSVSFKVIRSPFGKDLVLVSPWDYRARIPSSKSKAENFIRIVVVQRGERAALEQGRIIVALTERINKANSSKTFGVQSSQDIKIALAVVAKQYGFSADELDNAIRAYGSKTIDPYEVGITALYERNFSKASYQLRDSLQQREAKLITDKRALVYDREQITNAAFFLGLSLNKEGKYRESAESYQKCLQLYPEDAVFLKSVGQSYFQSGEWIIGEQLLRKAIIATEKQYGSNSEKLAAALGSLVVLLTAKGDTTEADQLCSRAQSIVDKLYGVNDIQTTYVLNDLADLWEKEGKFADAEQLYRKVLDIRQQGSAPKEDIAATLNNLGNLLEENEVGRYSEAETNLRNSLKIREEVFGLRHPLVAAVLNNLAFALQKQNQHEEAEKLYYRALMIYADSPGPNTLDTATVLNNVASLLERKGNFLQAEHLYCRALLIVQEKLGLQNSLTLKILNHLRRDMIEQYKFYLP